MRVRKAYKTLYRQGLTLAEALEELIPVAAQDDAVRRLVDSLNQATRGIIR